MKEEEFLRVVQKIDQKVLSSFERAWGELYVRATKENRDRLFNAFPELVKQLIEYYKSQNKKSREKGE